MNWTWVIDVDGVMTDGAFLYTINGKVAKKFGSDDSDALAILRPFFNIQFVSGDRRGLEITKRRIIDDMGYSLNLVSTIDRLSWIRDRFDLQSVIYMGDGIFDFLVMRGVMYGIAPANAHEFSLRQAQYVTAASGGNGAVAEACDHLLAKFYGKSLRTQILEATDLDTGEWQK